jgi:transcriptional regulator with XRE-family HTH domain
MSLGSNLKLLRKSRGWNQKEAASFLCVDYSKYNKWERGKNSPNLIVLTKLARAYHVSLDFLLNDDTNSK